MTLPQHASQHDDPQMNTSMRIAKDARADHGTRRVTLTNNMIHIERVLHGVKMRVHIPAKVYQGVRLLINERLEGDTYQIELAHHDPDLSVVLDASQDRQEAEDRQRIWAHFFEQPLLESAPAPIAAEDQKELFISAPRRRCMTHVAKRRPRRLARRKHGNRENLAIVHSDEREIICYE
jgi:hypothetical protein